jgi:hypothetical protein
MPSRRISDQVESERTKLGKAEAAQRRRELAMRYLAALGARRPDGSAHNTNGRNGNTNGRNSSSQPH